MNILFLTNLSGNLWAGPNNSVPARIAAQGKVDNVFWYNINNNRRKEWINDELHCYNFEDFPKGRLSDFPKPFNHPDFAIVEGVYCFPFCKLISDLQKLKIPYIIVPRSTLTIHAQKHKPIKKIVGNVIYFRKMVKRARAIQYLTSQEKIDSQFITWNKSEIIIPNGIEPYSGVKPSLKKNELKLVYIGRMETYQKGLDLLIEACNLTQEDFRRKNCKVFLYGPNQEGTREKLYSLVRKYRIDDIVFLRDTVIGNDKYDILEESDVFIMTSRFEGLPMGMLEALAYGLPCIATKGTNLSDVIEKYNAGWSAENNVESIVEAIKKMLKDTESFELYRTKEENAQKLAKNYTWDKLALNLHDRLIDLM